MEDTQTTSPGIEDDNTRIPAGEDAPSGPPGFSERGRMRRRMRFLRKARELAYRDLGGLVFDLHRFGRRNDALVLAKLETIGRIDGELRALEATLAERRPVTVLREAGVAACPRCAAIHGSDDRFCPNCGLAMDLRAERPMAGPQSTAQAPAPTPTTPPAPAPMPAPTPTMAQTAVHAPAPAAPTSGETAPPVPAGATATPATPAPSQTATTPPAPSTATPAPTAPAPSPAPPSPPPPSTAAPAPTTPAPRAPKPTAPAAPATAPPKPAAPAPAKDPTRPSGPTPAVDGDPAAVEDRPNVEEPTEIVRPPSQNP